MNFLANTMNNMSTEDKAKLGRTGSKLSADGSHLVSIKEFFIGNYDGSPNVQIKFEAADGKSVEWVGNLTTEVNVDDKTGKPVKEVYRLEGKPLVNPQKGDRCDNEATLGKIQNLCKLLGTTVEEAAAAATDAPAKSFGKDISAPTFYTLIGKQLTIVTSFELSLDKDNKRVWKNQVVSMTHMFNATGLSQLEVDTGITEGKALISAIKLAKAPKEQYTDIGYGIKYKDQKSPICLQELKLLGQAGVAPKAEAAVDVNEDEEPF